MDQKIKEKIDNMSYEEMFKLRRFAPIGDTLMIGDTGTYFLDVLYKKEKEIPSAERVAISKRIGWGD